MNGLLRVVLNFALESPIPIPIVDGIEEVNSRTNHLGAISREKGQYTLRNATCRFIFSALETPNLSLQHVPNY